MQTQILMIDVDGVIIVHPRPQGWSVNLERDLGISPEHLHETFFRPHFNDILLGRASLHERLNSVLSEIAPNITSETFVQYWFEQDAHLDLNLLKQLADIRKTGVALHLATNQEHERADYLWRTLGLQTHFDALHYAADLGCAKPSPEFFCKVTSRAGRPPADLFLIDDRLENVEAAQQCGWQAAVWTGKKHLSDVLLHGLAQPPQQPLRVV